MVGNSEEILRDGTLVRHKNQSYEGIIEGTTAIKDCFTSGGLPRTAPIAKESFQYRIAVSDGTMRRVAPLEDLEILLAAKVMTCVRCAKGFCTKPSVQGKAYGRCTCGNWICPVCLGCQSEDAANDKKTACADQRKRFLRKASKSCFMTGRNRKRLWMMRCCPMGSCSVR